MRLVLTGPIIRRRLALCMAAFFLLFCALTARLFYLQVVQAEDLQRRAQAQWTSQSVIAPTRGKILDRNGSVLVTNRASYNIEITSYVLFNSETPNESLLQVAELCSQLGVAYACLLYTSSSAQR